MLVVMMMMELEVYLGETDVGWSCKPCLKVLGMFVVVLDGDGRIP